MAQRTLSSITSALGTTFGTEVVNQINRSCVLAALLPVRKGVGKNVSWDARVGTATPSTAPIGDGTDVSTYNADTIVPATLNWGIYHDAFNVTGLAAAASRSINDPTDLGGLFVESLQESVERLASAISADAYVGTGSSNEFHGLLATAGPLSATGTYANIDRATYTQWASNSSDLTSTTAISFAEMRKMRRLVYTASGLKPDLIVCDPVTFASVGDLYGTTSVPRYMSQDVYLRGKKISLDAGFDFLNFDGIPVVEDKDCSANTMCFLNTRYINWEYLPNAVPGGIPVLGNHQLRGTEEEQFGEGNLPLDAMLLPLAVTGNAFKFALYCHVALRCRRPNAMGAIININN